MVIVILRSVGFKHGDSVALFMENRPEYIGVLYLSPSSSCSVTIAITNLRSFLNVCFLAKILPQQSKHFLSPSIWSVVIHSLQKCRSYIPWTLQPQVWLGCSKIGAVPALINYNLRGQSLLHRWERTLHKSCSCPVSPHCLSGVLCIFSSSIHSAFATAIIFGGELTSAVSDIQNELGKDVKLMYSGRWE